MYALDLMPLFLFFFSLDAFVCHKKREEKLHAFIF